MRRLSIILATLLLALSACNEKDKLQLEKMQEELANLEKSVGDLSLPEAGEVTVPPQGDFFFTFDQERYGVDAGSQVVVNYTLPEASQVQVEVNTKQGWKAEVSSGSSAGTITVTAPDPASSCNMVVTATAADGRQTATILPIMVRNPYSDATRPTLTAMGYYSFKPWNATLENYQKLADAGLNLVTVETDEEDYLLQMDLARQVGIKVLAVIGWATEAWYNNMSQDNLQRLKNLIDTLKDRPELYGYHICDEPNVSKIYELMAIEDKMTEIDPNHPVYVNLLPNASPAGMGANTYVEYVEVFASMMHLQQLSFDIYPIHTTGIQSDWHYCLETVSDAARRYGKPFWAFAASCWINLETVTTHKRAKPSVENILLQTYTNLAYGAQAVQYFTIQDYSGTDFAPIMRDGTWTEAYDFLKEAVLQMQKRAFIFKGSHVNKIRQTGVVSMYDQALAPADMPEEIEKVEVAASATVSFVQNEGNEYLVIANNYCLDQPMGIHLTKPVYMIDAEGQFHLYEAGGWSFTIPSGGMMAFKYR